VNKDTLDRQVTLEDSGCGMLPPNEFVRAEDVQRLVPGATRIVSEKRTEIAYSCRAKYQSEPGRSHQDVFIKIMSIRPGHEVNPLFVKTVELLMQSSGSFLPRLIMHEVAWESHCAYLVARLRPVKLLYKLISEQGLPIPKAVELLCVIADGLTRLHENKRWHLNLSPSNILVRGKHALCLPHLGVWIPSGNELGYVVGNDPTYSPPEYRQKKPVPEPTPAFDAYSLGRLSLDMIFGIPTARRIAVSPDAIEDRLRSLEEVDVSRRLASAVRRAMSQDQDIRFLSPTDFHNAIRPSSSRIVHGLPKTSAVQEPSGPADARNRADLAPIVFTGVGSGASCGCSNSDTAAVTNGSTRLDPRQDQRDTDVRPKAEQFVPYVGLVVACLLLFFLPAPWSHRIAWFGAFLSFAVVTRFWHRRIAAKMTGDPRGSIISAALRS